MQTDFIVTHATDKTLFVKIIFTIVMLQNVELCVIHGWK